MLTNLVRQPGTIHTLTRSGNGVNDGADGLDYDNDFNTIWGRHADQGEGGNEIYITSQHEWAVAKAISELRVKLYSYASAANHDAGAYVEGFIALYYAGAWNNVWTALVNNTIHDLDLTTGWAGVTGIKVYIHCHAYTWGEYGNTHTIARIYEVQVFGQVYEDTGLRVYTPGGAVAIGGDYPADSSHHFRCYGKGNKVWGIPHLNTSDPNASKIRVYHNGVFALPKAG